MTKSTVTGSTCQLIRACTLTLLAALPFVAGAQSEPAPSIMDYSATHHAVVDTRGIVSVQNAIAAEVGAAILEEGGNAVDAAVAVGFALAVTLPRAGNIGGGGFMLVHLAEDDRTVAIDYREMAPAAATRDMYLDDEGNVDERLARFSHRSAGVPGTVAGLHHALTRYGTMRWRDVIEPAIRIADKGMIVSLDLSEALKRRSERLTANASTRAVYYREGGTPYEPGEVLRQPDLAWTLRQIARRGPEAFYEGAVAARIVADMEANDGLITAEDLANYKVIEREPLRGSYRGYEIVSMPPPSSGGVHVIQMLNVLENYSLADAGFGSAEALHLMAESMRLAYADRSRHLGDPDFYDVPLDWLTSKRYGAVLADSIDPLHARPSADVAPGVPTRYESPDTTHYGVVDRFGNAVANTYTLNFSYGSGIVVPGTGMLLNNEMDDFSSKPGVPNAFGLLGGEANAIEPGKRPLSSMTPTMVLRDGKPFIVTGSPGGSTIINSVLQVIVNIIDHGMSVAEAVAAPRIHHQWFPDRLTMENDFSPDTVRLLQAMGHNVNVIDRTIGSAQTITLVDGVAFGGADPRRPDAASIGPRMLECRESRLACAY
jgi:gamma-glutamyltranspeptidase/glutathione hydrolase